MHPGWRGVGSVLLSCLECFFPLISGEHMLCLPLALISLCTWQRDGPVSASSFQTARKPLPLLAVQYFGPKR